MITQDSAESALLELTEGTSFKHQEWNGKFKALKLASSTEKGNIGEDFLARMARECGYTDAEVVKERRGQYDVRIGHGDKEVTFEVKVATLDTNNSFQFNGIRYDTKYTHLFCLGISPNTIGFLVIDKKELDKKEQGDYKMVSMQKGGSEVFKLTRREDALLGFEAFAEVLSGLF